MTIRRLCGLALAGAALTCSSFVAGCGQVDSDGPADTEPVTTSELHHRFPGLHHNSANADAGAGAVPLPEVGGAPATPGTGGSSAGEPIVGTGGTTGAAPVSDCDVCTKANACCNAVGGGPLCTFSATTCVGLAPESREPYIRTCLNLIDTAASAHADAPAAACGK
jgi:hypothetical protein